MVSRPRSLHVVIPVKINQRTYRSKADEVKDKKIEKSRTESSCRVRGCGCWPDDLKEELLLLPNYEIGYIAAIRQDDWEGSRLALALADFDSELDDAVDDDLAERLKRVRAASVYGGSLSNGRVAIPRDIAWLLQRENEERDITLVHVEPVVELWPTRRWEDYLAGHLFNRAQHSP